MYIHSKYNKKIKIQWLYLGDKEIQIYHTDPLNFNSQ